MPLSNYPNGFPNGLAIRGVPIAQSHTGQVFWVGNSTVLPPNQRGASDSNRGGINDPFSTLQKALDSCTASRGDIIFIKPGHAETVSSATALAFNKAGVAIVGLGSGTARPTFTLDTANTTTTAAT